MADRSTAQIVGLGHMGWKFSRICMAAMVVRIGEVITVARNVLVTLRVTQFLTRSVRVLWAARQLFP